VERATWLGVAHFFKEVFMKRKVTNKDFLDALKKHYEAEVDKNMVTLHLYLNNPMAVADHETLLESMKMLTKQLADAQEALSTLETHFE
jgi:hypothetical protein